MVTKRPIKVYLRMTRFTDTDNGGIVWVWRMLVQCGSLSLCTQNLRKFPLSFQECWRGLSGPRGTLQGSADGWRLKKINKNQSSIYILSQKMTGIILCYSWLTTNHRPLSLKRISWQSHGWLNIEHGRHEMVC